MKLVFSLAVAIAILLPVPTAASSQCVEFRYTGLFGDPGTTSIHNKCDECRKVLIKTINCFGEKSQTFEVKRNSSKRILLIHEAQQGCRDATYEPSRFPVAVPYPSPHRATPAYVVVTSSDLDTSRNKASVSGLSWISRMRFAQPARPSRQIQCWSKNWALGEESHCASTNALSLRSTQRLASPQHSATESSVTANAIDSSEKGAEQGADRLAYEAAERLRTVAAYKAVIQHFPESVYGKLTQESIRLLAENGTLEAVEAILYLTRTDRQMIQIGLIAQGFSPGPANGMFGPEMRTLLRSWQTASGHVPTGWLTREEANALKEAGAEAY